ncbi:hypothetical protein EON80_02770 [bacterium]|nr:MAG: hypothetical protein EON80_02770 [bacterium]
MPTKPLVNSTVVESDKSATLKDTSPQSSSPEAYNYRRFTWVIVLIVFAIFFLADMFEHGVLPRFNTGIFRWYFTTTVATLLSGILGWAFLRNIENAHQELVSRNQSLAEQSQMLELQSKRLALTVQEAHHRIKNNLQTVAALLSWYDTQGEIPQNALRESMTRIRAIALVHDLLTNDTPLSEVNAAQVVTQICESLVKTMDSRDNITFDTDLQSVHLPSRQATSLALVLNELILNSFEHAFPHRERGHIFIVLKDGSEDALLTVTDSGVGLPKDFDLDSSGRTGLQIARSLVEEDLAGTLRLTSSEGTSADSGTSAEVRFKKRYDTE